MKLTKISANVTKVELSMNLTVWFSYETPVVAKVGIGYDAKMLATDTNWSRTTNQHINSILEGNEFPVERVDQSVIDNLVADK